MSTSYVKDTTKILGCPLKKTKKGKTFGSSDFSNCTGLRTAQGILTIWTQRPLPFLNVIGDKKGGSTASRLNELRSGSGGSKEHMLTTFEEFQQTIGLPIHIIHVYWKKDKVYKNTDKLIKILQEGMPSSNFKIK